MFLNASERRSATAISRIGDTNPFLPERIELERQALGSAFVEYQPVMNLDVYSDAIFPNFVALKRRAGSLATKMRARLYEGNPANDSDLSLYVNLVLYLLYSKHMSYAAGAHAHALEAAEAGERVSTWRPFFKDYRHFLSLPERSLPLLYEPDHVFAVYFQIERAFKNIFECIIGASMPMARLRAAVWQSIFSHDMKVYGQSLYGYMKDISTLITGPSGTGKELVARAIALSRYIEFNPETQHFATSDSGRFRALNLSAFAPTLIESELFGHKKGAFTGANEDRPGHLELCGPLGTVFLDEIGELDLAIQVKLLRVLQERKFRRVGDADDFRFQGKFVAATNRDLVHEIRRKRFREDLYFRLCADMIQTPSLGEQLSDCPEDLEKLVRFITRRILTDLPEAADDLARNAVKWIREHLAQDYPWPGNIRELEQCVRNIMIRKTYQPPALDSDRGIADARRRLARTVASGAMKLSELVEHYCSLAYATHRSYERAAKRLDVDWRTVRKNTRPELVELYGSNGIARNRRARRAR